MFGGWLRNALLKTILKGESWENIVSMQMALWIGDPGPTGLTGVEVTGNGNGYERISIGSGDWNPVLDNFTSNVMVLTFPEATAFWGIVTHVVILGQLALGVGWTFMFYGALDEAVDISEGAIARFPLGELMVTLT